MAYTIKRFANREEWLQSRKEGIGSSEVGTIMGRNKFDTPIRLWRRKLGLEGPTEETEAMWMGHMAEVAVANCFASKTGAIIDENSTDDFLFIDTEKPYLRVSPDRLFWLKGTSKDQQTLENAFILECKTTTHCIDENPDLEYKFDIPDYWFYQIQYQMGVMGIKKCVIAWISCAFGRFHFDYTWVPFYPSIYAYVKKELVKFWEVNVMQKIMPEHIIDKEDIKIAYPIASSTKKVIANLALKNIIRELNLARQTETDAKNHKEDLSTQVKTLMGDAEFLMDEKGNVLATFKNSSPKKDFNEKQFALDHPELYNQYVVEKPSRTFLPKPVKD